MSQVKDIFFDEFYDELGRAVNSIKSEDMKTEPLPEWLKLLERDGTYMKVLRAPNHFHLSLWMEECNTPSFLTAGPPPSAEPAP